MAEYKVSLSIGYVNARREDVLEIPDEDLEGLSSEEIEDFLQNEWLMWANDYIDGGIARIDGELSDV